MQTVPTEVVACGGLPADTYDRYVLGLLTPDERALLDAQIERQCPVCISGVQRSMNLWLVFANSLEQTEPAADFRGRLVRIAELSNRVLTVPKRHRRVREPAILISSLVIICLIFVALLIFTYIAGRQSARMDSERATNQLQRLTVELTNNQVTIQRQGEQIRSLEQKQSLSGPFSVAQHTRLENSLSTAQATVQQYGEIIKRLTQQATENTSLVTALSAPGTKLMAFHSPEGVPSSAYAMVVADSKIIFVAGKLGIPPNHRQYQLWLLQKDELPAIGAGVFLPGDDNKPVVLTFSDDKKSIENLAGMAVTEEPENGSSTPMGLRIMETAGVAAPLPAASSN